MGLVQKTVLTNMAPPMRSVAASSRETEARRKRARTLVKQQQAAERVATATYRGGQVKFNVTKTFSNGMIRVYGKYLDDRPPSDQPIPMTVTGSNFSPSFASIPNFDLGFRNA